MITVNMKSVRLAAMFALAFGLLCGTASAQGLPVGEGEFHIDAPRGRVPVYTYKPADFGSHSPVWVIMHGVGRTANNYYDAWLPEAKRYGAMLLVPRFSKEDWSMSWRYALGNVSTSRLIPLPRRDWAFTVVQEAFDYAMALEGTGQKRFYLYGHSAGGQFTHRYVMYTGGEKIALAISANAGWYILPDYKFTFPYGFRAVPVSEATRRRAFATPMVILLGERDISWASGVRKEPQTNLQGPHRLARGKFFHDYSRKAAAQAGYAYRWRLQTVPGAGHRNDEMASAAAAIFARAHGIKVSSSEY
jgi:poly(3-hydroxybutyrate) depolymerase